MNRNRPSAADPATILRLLRHRAAQREGSVLRLAKVASQAVGSGNYKMASPPLHCCQIVSRNVDKSSCPSSHRFLIHQVVANDMADSSARGKILRPKDRSGNNCPMSPLPNGERLGERQTRLTVISRTTKFLQSYLVSQQPIRLSSLGESDVVAR